MFLCRDRFAYHTNKLCSLLQWRSVHNCDRWRPGFCVHSPHGHHNGVLWLHSNLSNCEYRKPQTRHLKIHCRIQPVGWKGHLYRRVGDAGIYINIICIETFRHMPSVVTLDLPMRHMDIKEHGIHETLIQISFSGFRNVHRGTLLNSLVQPQRLHCQKERRDLQDNT